MDNPPTFGSVKQTSWLGRVYVLGGKGDYPCYRAELRAAYRLKDASADEAVREVVKETVSLRSLMMSTVSETVPPQKTALHAPFLLRLHAAALDKLKANVLDIGGKKGLLLPLSGHDYGDLLVSPAVAKWPDQIDPHIDPNVPDDEFGYEKAQISVPPFRIHGGETRVSLVLDIKKELCKFLQAGERSLFGGLVPRDVTSSGQEKVLPISLVAEGIEFNGSLPDPTRHDDRAAARIIGRFRLEYDPRRPDGGYLLRLVAEPEPKPGVLSEAMDALEARIGGAFADLALESESPLAISLDRRPVVPPLIWPLALKDGTLSLIPAAESTSDFEMEIDRAAATVRLRTRSNYPGEAPGLASVLVERISWIKTNSGFDVRVVAGTLDAETQISLDFNKEANAVWSTTFAATKEKAPKTLPVTIPLYDQAQRMLELYKQARAKAPADNHAAYLYFPVAEGWLQLGLPKEKNSMPSQSVSKQSGKLSVLSGKLVAGTGTGVGRGVRVNDAQALSLTMHWKSKGGKIGADSGNLLVSGVHAVFRGFLFAAETSPTAAEALPDLRNGPAATREMPIHVGGGEHRLALSGKFSWGALSNDWALDVDQIVGNNLDTGDPAPVNYAWLPAAPNPFVSNHPLTRSAASATEPSLSRGLLPMRFGQAFSLRVEKDAALPRLQPKGDFVWEEGMFKDRGDTFRGDTLLLPTLAGVEFYPLLPGLSIEAALRFDIPLLDELFAWSDPPLESLPPKSGKNPVPSVPKALAVTSLDMPGMREVWRVNRARMALTRTQAAFATPWQTVGRIAEISVDSLVEPYAWITTFGVEIATSPYGKYSLNGVDYTPELAVGGLNRVFFSPEGKELVVKGIDGPIQVAGFAASLFDLDGRLWDSRGFGMAAKAASSGRQASYRSLKEGKLEHRDFTLFTMPGPLTLWKKDRVVTDGSQQLGFPLDLHFYVRDLALVDGVFNGCSNPIESGPGITGQAFLPAAFSASLHEWRFFEEPEETNNVRRHDIAYGPFRFKPLRLIYAKFSVEDVLEEIRIVGSMRLDLDPALSMEGATPFGPDEVYRGGDLFELILTDLHLASTGAWQHVWRPVSAEVNPKNPGLLEFNTRDNVIHCAIVLEKGAGGILSAEDRRVPAVIEFDLSGSATLKARLFGNSATLKCAKYVVSENGINLDFSPSAAAPHVPREHGVWLDAVKISVLIRESKSTLRIDGSLLVMAAGATLPTADAALVMFGSDTWRWLELTPKDGDKGEPLVIDHQTGVLSARWSVTGEKGKAAPLLFGLTQKDFVASGAIEAIVAGMEITDNNGLRIGMASAWMRVSSIADEGRTVVDHRLLIDAGRAEHTLDISATVAVNSPILWPLDGIMKMKEDGSEADELDLEADEWTDPGQGKAPLTPLSRVFSIRGDEAQATHSLTLRLKRHRIDAARLGFKDGLVSVLEPVLLLAVAEHRLVQGDRSAVWTSLDYVTFTTASAILAATAVDQKKKDYSYYFAPRFRYGRFRNQYDKSTIKRPGIIPMSLALSGFYDPCMVDNLWGKLKPDKLIILGGSALQFRLQRGERSLLAVMPWMHLQENPWINPPKKEVKLTQSGGTWHTPSAEIWSANALKNMESVRAIGLAADLDAPAVAQRFDAAGLSGPVAGKPMADVLPVEQAWFEKWEDNKAVPMKSEDLISAPFFLRTLLVLARRWHHDDDVVAAKPETKISWNVASLHPCRTDAGRERPNKGGPGLIRVEIRAERQWQVPYREPVTLVPADLVVLSRTKATLIPSYRLVAQEASNNNGESTKLNSVLVERAPDEDRAAMVAIQETLNTNRESTKLNAVLVERALDEDRAAMVAIQETLNTAGGPEIDRAYVPRSLDDCLSRPDGEVRVMPEINPSGALGWPSPVGLQGLERMAARLGSELPVLSGQAGFSARFQRFGWPALAIRAGQNYPGQVEAPAPEAYYFSFANRIVFDRDTQLAFDGPPARHLMPSPVRRRAPVNAGVQGILNALTGDKPQKGMKPVAEPLLLPGIERTTIGRRPGVFEVAVASLTIPSDVGPFDPDYARFGRPGCSGPLAAHQLRTPRSPTLPGDADDNAIAELTQSSPLAFRRRTYLSEVDRDDEGHFILFKSFGGNVDVVRFGSGSGQVRVAFSVVGGDLIGQNWDGKIAVLLNARARDGKEGANEVAGLQLEGDARLEIGNRTFALKLPEKDAFRWECQGLGDAREMLRAASADTPIRLVFGVRPKSVLPQSDLDVKITGLPPARISLCRIRLALDPGIRSVLPVSTTTIAFGDPSYDRQLASPTKDAQQVVEEDSDGKKVSRRILLAADRKQYDVASTLYLAFGVIERESGWFSKDSGKFKPYLRITYSRTGDKDNKSITSALLTLRGAQCDDDDKKRYLLKQGEPYAIALSQLILPEDTSGRSALAPGDRLTLSVMYDGKNELPIAVDIVAEPVIAPAPCVYSVIGSDAAHKVMSVVLHAAAPLPQRIEFEDLARDLALGHVRRRGLFVWCWASLARSGSTVELVKFDRSGGAQVPPLFTSKGKL